MRDANNSSDLSGTCLMVELDHHPRGFFFWCNVVNKIMLPQAARRLVSRVLRKDVFRPLRHQAQQGAMKNEYEYEMKLLPKEIRAQEKLESEIQLLLTKTKVHETMKFPTLDTKENK